MGGQCLTKGRKCNFRHSVGGQERSQGSINKSCYWQCQETGQCEIGIIIVGAPPPICIPSVYLILLHLTRSPRLSPSIFACCKRSNTGGGSGLGMRLPDITGGVCERSTDSAPQPGSTHDVDSYNPLACNLLQAIPTLVNISGPLRPLFWTILFVSHLCVMHVHRIS